MTTRDDYPRDHKPGAHWATNISWQIMDLIEPGAISSPLRDMMSGIIAGALVEARKLGVREGDAPGPKIHEPAIAHLIELHSEQVPTFIRAHLPAALLPAFAQHIRDFDVANPGCHFEIAADVPDKPLAEVIEMLRIHPSLTFTKVFQRSK